MNVVYILLAWDIAYSSAMQFDCSECESWIICCSRLQSLIHIC